MPQIEFVRFHYNISAVSIGYLLAYILVLLFLLKMYKPRKLEHFAPLIMEVNTNISNMPPVYITLGFLIWLYFFKRPHETISPAEQAFRDLLSRELEGFAPMQKYVDELHAGIREGGSETHIWEQALAELVATPEFISMNSRVGELRELSLAEAAKSIHDSPLGSLQGLCSAARRARGQDASQVHGELPGTGEDSGTLPDGLPESPSF
jgi:hypothetical protein